MAISSNMHVVQIVDSIATSAGGTARATLELATSLSQICNIDCSVVTRKCDSSELAHQSGVEIFKLPTSRSLQVAKDIWDVLLRLHKARPIDLIHINGIWSPILHFAATYAWDAKIPYVIAPHGMLEPWSMQQKHLKKKIAWNIYQKRDLAKAAAIQVTASSELESIKRLCTFNTFVVPNGLHIPDIEQDSIRDKKVLFLSRVHPKKGIPLLLNSWAKLRPAGWKLQIVGPGDKSYIESIKAMVRELDINSSVEVHPEADDITKHDLYRRASLFVLPTYSENFGLVVAEAMAMELPVITTQGTPWTNLSEIGCGWCISLSQSNLTSCLAEALALSPEQLQLMGSKGRTFVKRHLAWDHVSRQMVIEYEKILSLNPKRHQNPIVSVGKIANESR